MRWWRYLQTMLNQTDQRLLSGGLPQLVAVAHQVFMAELTQPLCQHILILAAFDIAAHLNECFRDDGGRHLLHSDRWKIQ
jgi:hypothetical protein